MTGTALAVIFSPASAVAAPLQPTSKWVVDYTPSSCTARRNFGDHAISIVPSPLGSSTRVIVEGPGRALRARQFQSVIDPDDGQGAVKASSLIYPFKAAKGRRGIYSVISNELVSRMLVSGKVDIRAGRFNGREGTPESRLIWADRPVTSMGAALAIGGGASLNKALEACMVDLRKHWGMIDGQLPQPAIANIPTGSVSGLFTSSDYPEDAITADQMGDTSFTLMIDEKGNVMDCAIRQSSGIATLDAMGCQVIRERGKFSPAKDASGRSVKGIFLTPLIRWRLAG